MGNILFQQNQPKSKNSVLNQLAQIKQSGPSNLLFQQMYNNNLDFKRFADSVQGMTPEQAFKQYGLDFNQFRNQRW